MEWCFQRVGRIITALPQSASALDFKSKYSKFAHMYFGGDMPPLGTGDGEVVLRMATLKRETGRVAYAWKRTTKEIVGPIKLTMSNQLMMEEVELNGTFLHEMIHVWLAYKGDFKDNHGPTFIAKAREVGHKFGTRISISHDTSKLSYNPDVLAKAKPVVILVKDIPSIDRALVAMISEKTFLQNKQSFIDGLHRAIQRQHKEGTGYIFIDTHELQHKLPIQRGRIKSYHFIDRHKIETLLRQDGVKLIKKIEYEASWDEMSKEERETFLRDAKTPPLRY